MSPTVEEVRIKVLFLYFSGTGNTDYVARYLAERLARPSLEIELRSVEHQAPEAVGPFDLLAVGFPVYACEAPDLVRDYLARLPAGEGRGAWVFCTKGAYAGGAVEHNLWRLASRGYLPLGGGSVTMPGTDGLSMIGKDSWLARKALDKDFDHLQDADGLAAQMAGTLEAILAGRDLAGQARSRPPRIRTSLWDAAWAAVYRASEKWCRDRLHAGASCEGCGLCVRICPVDNVTLRDGHAEFADRCALCLRCLHACPREAIQIGKLTVGKFRWRGPKGTFRPLRMRPEGD